MLDTRARRLRWVGRLRRGIAVLAVLGVVWASVIVVGALRMDGNDTLTARVAESARDHGLGFVVTGLEGLQYRLSPPRTGGTLSAAEQKALAASVPTAGTAPVPIAAGGPASGQGARDAGPPVSVPVQVQPAVGQEGVYQLRVGTDSRPLVRTTLLRPDPQHTSYLAGVAWMSGSLLRYQQHPGAADPGRLASWSAPPTIPAASRADLVASFNGGFKIADSRGAYFADGVTVGHFRPGAASLVVYSDGHVDIGAWGAEVSMTPQVASVRQNLDLLVDGGQVVPAVDSSTHAAWGATVGSAAYVWRSGIGVTATGDVVYVAGDALSARTLANLLRAAGAQRAMELDINRDWVSYMWYPMPRAVPHKLVDFFRPADRYFTTNSRDFFTVSLR